MKLKTQETHTFKAPAHATTATHYRSG